VQSITIMSIDSYEEHVASLVKGKRNLFNNVIDPDASEDVVGVSKKLLETLIEDLADDVDKSPTGQLIATDAEPVLPDMDETGTEDGEDLQPETNQSEDTADQKLEKAIQYAIEQIQQQFATKIEQILGSGGGLLVVLDQVDAEANRVAETLSTDDVPIALIDTQTLGGLQRLGEASPLQQTTSYYQASESSEDEADKESPLIAIAKEKLEAAEILLEQEIYSIAADLLITSLLASVAGKAGLDQAPKPEEAGIWVYTEALSNGWLDEQQANQIMRNLAVVQAPEIPVALLEELLADVRSYVDG
jgi:hypothetical protein